MKSKRKTKLFSYTSAVYSVNVWLLLFMLINVLSKATAEGEGNEKILSRRRRYLIFPKGTSIQLSNIKIYIYMYIVPNMVHNVLYYYISSIHFNEAKLIDLQFILFFFFLFYVLVVSLRYVPQHFG